MRFISLVAPALIASACAHAQPASPPTIRGEIEGVVRAMEAAAKAGDRDGYLRHVWTGDAMFRIEQEHWADELPRYKPAELTLRVIPDAEIPEGDGRFSIARGPSGGHEATLTLEIRYRMDVGHAARPEGRSARWPARFVAHDPDGDGPQPERWLYAGDVWETLEGVGFVVKFQPGSEAIARMTLEAFPIAKAHVDAGFEIKNDTRQEIKLYDDMEHLKASVFLNMPDDVLGGWNEPGESIKFMTWYAGDVPSWKRAYAHEYGHVATWVMGPEVKRTMPWWLVEGVAELAAEDFFSDDERATMAQAVRNWTRTGRLVPWDRISDYQTTEASLKWQAYVQGHEMVGYLSDRFGRGKRNAWLRAMGQGATLGQATKDVLGVDFSVLDAEWRAAMTKAHAPAPARSGP